MTIHADHPFAGGDDDPVRRFRGRLGGTVSLWTAGEERERAGLTVTSFLLAHGSPARVVGALDPESELVELLAERRSGTVALLEWGHRDLAETFAGLLPSPGGAFRAGEWHQSAWGPVPVGCSAWLGMRLAEDPRPVGWSMLVEAEVEHVEVGESHQPLLHRRGRYRTLD